MTGIHDAKDAHDVNEKTGAAGAAGSACAADDARTAFLNGYLVRTQAYEETRGENVGNAGSGGKEEGDGPAPSALRLTLHDFTRAPEFAEDSCSVFWCVVCAVAGLFLLFAPLLIIASLTMGSGSAHAQDCTFVSQVCADSADRVINGQTVHRECWRWEKTYRCTEVSPEAERCRAGNLPETCSITEVRCTATDPDNPEACWEETSDLLCKTFPEGPGITAGEPVVTVTTTSKADPAVPDASNPSDPLVLQGCRITARSCLDSNPKEVPVTNWPGHTTTVTGTCWKEAVEVSCPEADAALSCQKLEDAGCEPKGEKTCELEGPGGACLRWSAVYVCAGVPVEGDDIVVDGSEDVPDGSVIEDTSACDAAVAEKENEGLKCEATAFRCLKPGETVMVDGKPVTMECALKEVTFTCTGEGENGCKALEELADSGVCRLEGEPVCDVWDEAAGGADGGTKCLKQTATFICGSELDPENPPEDAEFIEKTEEVEVKPVNECEAPEKDPACVETADVCTEGPGIKIVDGVPVYKDCWMRTKTFVCRASGEDECAKYADDPQCELVSEECVDGDEARSGDGNGNAKGSGTLACARPTRVYKCTRPGGETVVGEVCDGESCIAGVCVPTDDPAGEDFIDSVIAGEIAREGSLYGDLTGNRFFAGEHQWCKDRMGASSCCRREVVADAGNSMFSTALVFGLEAGVELVKFVGSPFVYDVLASSDYTSGLLNMLYGSSVSGVYEPSMGFWGVTFTWTSTGEITVGFSPAGFMAAAAMRFWQNYSSCDAMDQKNAMAKGQNLCVYLGTTCEKKVPGFGCVKHQENYACFNSVLARIINEQGRAQVGRGWGAPDHPDVDGFTIDEMNRLDFSKIDFSEFVASVVNATKTADDVDLEAAKARAEERLREMLEGELGNLSPVPGANGKALGDRPSEGKSGRAPTLRKAGGKTGGKAEGRTAEPAFMENWLAPAPKYFPARDRGDRSAAGTAAGDRNPKNKTTQETRA